MMIDAHIHRIVVVNADAGSKRPIGIVSSMDILAVLARVDQMHMITEERKTKEVPASVLP